ncbi:MAG: hypothetical protein JSY10_17650 [Paenibacillus sp.]|nr:hypothetical protein [Paenibacillus sp.]
MALAKAIKTPEPGAIDAEPWSKSIIFNQPFIKQLQQQKEQVMNRRDVRPKLQNRRKSHSSLNLGNFFFFFFFLHATRIY